MITWVLKGYRLVRSWTSLHNAAERGNANVVKALLSIRVNPNPRNSDLETPLYLASRGYNDQGRLENVEGQIRCISALIAAGADVNAANINGRTPLCNATAYQQVEIVKLLLTANPDVNKSSQQDWITPLHCAAMEGNITIVKLLLKAKTIHSIDLQHNTPLHYAARNFHPDIVKLFLDTGVPSNAKNICGKTPLVMAQEYLKTMTSQGFNIGAEYTQTINLLKAANEKVNTGNTAAPTGALMINYGPGYRLNNTNVSRASSRSINPSNV